MCGIGGIVRAEAGAAVGEDALRRMAGALHHRGPDGYGLALGGGAGFVSTRLAIFDIPRGWQPLWSGPGGSLIVYNGEVYNHPELRAELARDGIECATLTDTEVVHRMLERDGLAALDRFNGQFAFAWWQPEERRLTLVRDRFGVRPLHYAVAPDGSVVFASEAKGLFASGEVEAAPDLEGIDEVFTLWGSLAPRSPFRGVHQVGAGRVLVWERGRLVTDRAWWRPEPGREADADPRALDELLRDSVRLRLRADVPVGSYLSGGLDSSLVSALATEASDHRLRTFSVAFSDERFDERRFQQEVAAALGTEHHVVDVGPGDIADAFRRVVRHAETPLIRTAPAPLDLLARETRAQGITVVASGEGADELFWGYDLFKEVVLRREAEHDETALDRLAALYPYLAAAGGDRRGPAWRRFFADAGAADDPLFSHQTRANATAVVKAFYRPEVAAELPDGAALERLRARLPEGFGRWSALERAAYLEVTTLLEPYLLAAQGDRVAMAHGVEGRYPFLDHRVFDHAAALPPARKLDGMRDKIALRELAADVLPAGIAERPKLPYRAPETAAFFSGEPEPWVLERLSPEALRTVGIFDDARVEGLVRRCRAGRATGPREGMALVGVLSTQVWHETFCAPSERSYPPETSEPRVLVDIDVERVRAGVT
jgi:asparagine synthase (glutamine-hydrolysing)